MSTINNYFVLNINTIITQENYLQDLFSTFSCPLNLEVETFLKRNSIEFAKKHQAITFLIISIEENALVGYFSLAIKPLVINSAPFSNSEKRKLARFSELNEIDKTYNLSAYLIAQLGKNFNPEIQAKISGDELLKLALNRLCSIQFEIGGMVTFVEAENNMKLLDYYSRNGYKIFATRKSNSQNQQLIQLLKIL